MDTTQTSEEIITNFNPRKKRICDVYLGKKFYAAYEYDLRDMLDIEELTQNRIPEPFVISAMLRKAIPSCPFEELEKLTQVELSELISTINVMSQLARTRFVTSTIH